MTTTGHYQASSTPAPIPSVWVRLQRLLLGGSQRGQRGLTLTVVLPTILFYLVFRYYPVVQTMVLSVTDARLLRTTVNYVGVKNFVDLLTDPVFLGAVWNSTYYAFATTILTTVIALALAFVFEPVERWGGFFRIIYFLPQVTSAVAIATIWLWLYQSRFGLFNELLGMIRISPISWLTSLEWAMPSIIIMSVWAGVGYSSLIFVAGLKGIPNEFVEAAIIDGASGWDLVRYVKLPLMQPVITFVFVTGIIGSFQVFQQIFVMTQGGPLNATDVISLEIYETAFQRLRFGLAGAMSVILFVVVGILTIVQLRVQRYDWEL